MKFVSILLLIGLTALAVYQVVSLIKQLKLKKAEKNKVKKEDNNE